MQAEVFNSDKLIIFVEKFPDLSEEIDTGSPLQYLINIGLFGLYSDSEKGPIEHCIRQYSDNILFLFDGGEMRTVINAASTLQNSKIIVTCRGKADHNICSTIIGISSAGRNSLLHRFLNDLLGAYNVGTHLPKLRDFCDNFTSYEGKILSRQAIFIQFVSVIYFTQHCNTSAIQHLLSKRDVIGDLTRSLLQINCQSRVLKLFEDYLGSLV